MKKIFPAVLALLFSCLGAAAQQQPMSPEEKAKKMEEFIAQQVERLERSLNLEDWQTFYTDSILTHDYTALEAELQALQDAKVSNQSIYTQVSDKWAEKIYDSMRGILSDEQWAKYLKTGAAREKKARDKRKAKVEESTAKVK